MYTTNTPYLNNYIIKYTAIYSYEFVLSALYYTDVFVHNINKCSNMQKLVIVFFFYNDTVLHKCYK